MIFGILTLITALAISAVAIYYSVAGLVAIFAAAALPIMIMGGTLEIAKLVTAVWLHKYWKQATWWLKSYLSLAVVVLMLITSMGIFGFLSKAHIEQTAQSTDNLAQVETLQSEIDRNLAIIGRAENKIRELDNSQSNTDTTIQDQIDREQERIDTAYDRVQPLVEEQTRNLEDQIALFGLDKVDAKIVALEQAMNINTRDRDAVRVLQSMVGARPDGAYGSGTAARVDEYRNGLNAERDAVLAKIQEARRLTNEEIARIRQGAENQIAESNKLINRLREQLGTQDNADEIQKAVDEQSERVRLASKEIDSLSEQKIALESEYRKLEAEVGPIKYIAEFVYGENADTNMLEEAVRWVIMIIIFVFDPLAVLLLIASQYTFEFNRKRKDDDGERLRREYEQARAQRIVDNPGFTLDDTVPTSVENSDDNKTTEDKEDVSEPRQQNTEEEQQDVAELREWQEEESVPPEAGDNPVVAKATHEEGQLDKIAKSYIANESAVVEKKDIELSEEFEQERAEELDRLDSLESWNTAKTLWKEDHPNENLKTYKRAYIKGHVDKLPWEAYLPQEVFEDNKFVEKHIPRTEGYVQNQEQSDESIWKRIKDDQSNNTT